MTSPPFKVQSPTIAAGFKQHNVLARSMRVFRQSANLPGRNNTRRQITNSWRGVHPFRVAEKRRGSVPPVITKSKPLEADLLGSEVLGPTKILKSRFRERSRKSELGDPQCPREREVAVV